MENQVVIMNVKGFKLSEDDKFNNDEYFKTTIDGEKYVFKYGIDKYNIEIRNKFDTELAGPLTDTEFDLLIGYIEGHGYMPVICDDGDMYRHNIEDSKDELQEYTAFEFIDYVMDANTEMIDELEPEDESYDELLEEYKNDEKILDSIYGRIIE